MATPIEGNNEETEGGGPGMPIVEVSGVTVAFLLIVAVLLAFVTEVVPNDVTAISVVAALVVLEPWTGVDARAAFSGFANPATAGIAVIWGV